MAKKRKDGEGTLRLRKDGRWEGRIIIGYDEKDKAITKTVTARSKRACETKLKELRTKHAPAIGVSRRQAKPDMKLADWLDMWYKLYVKPKSKIGTHMQYETFIYQHINPRIGEIPLSKLTQEDIQTFLSNEKKNGRLALRNVYGAGMSDSSVRKMGIIISSALRKATEQKLLRSNPAKGTKLPPKKQAEIHILTHEQFRNLLLQAKEDGAYEIILLELSTGVRRGELCGLKWDDLNFSTGALRISRQIIRTENGLEESSLKTKESERTVYLPDTVLQVMRELKEKTDSPWIFPSPRDSAKPRDPKALRKKVINVMEHAGITGVRFHDLRHTFATYALEYGMDVKTVSMIIGHSSVTTTLNTYSHITSEMEKKAAEKIEGGIGSSDAFEEHEAKLPEPEKRERLKPFKPYKRKYRRSGTGGIYKLNDHLYEGRYTPTNAQGKREPHNVYAQTYEECEQKLNAMIEEVKARIKKEKGARKEQSNINS